MTYSCLVVGGAGYIGSHMCRVLLAAGHRVCVFDNLSRGHRDAIGGAGFVEGDVRSMPDLARAFAAGPFDVVMDFAALAYVGESVLQPALYYDNNLRGSLNLINAMLASDTRHLVFSSTCATYGDPTAGLLTEAHPQRPVNPYGRTKLMVEAALRDYGAAHVLRSISLRYFNAAGCDPSRELGERHDPETHLIPLAIREALRIAGGGDPAATELSILGADYATPDGTCVRDYVHVNDLCAAHLAAARRLLSGVVAGAEAYNLGTGIGHSVRQVIDTCRRVTGMDIRYRVAPRRAGDCASLVASAERAREVLDWQAGFTQLDDIIRTAWDRALAVGHEGAVR